MSRLLSFDTRHEGLSGCMTDGWNFACCMIDVDTHTRLCSIFQLCGSKR